MARSTLHTTDNFLDAAADLFAGGGARAVTMAAVARTTGAPSGSVYHRFSSRGALLGALWHRTSSEFEAEYRAVLGPDPTPDTAVSAAAWIVEWCRDQPVRATVLNAGPRTFDPHTWPEEALTAHRAARKALDRTLTAIISAVAAGAGVEADEASFAMFGLPMAVVGTHLRLAEPVPAGAVDLVARLAARLLRCAPPGADVEGMVGRGPSTAG
jgi:AcrR family transcriptional regulator